MPTDIRTDLQATLGDGFRITRELTGGGMSRVFVAVEEQLDREVVVKLLPPDLMAGLSVERFRAEIHHAAKLQHPHIIPVLSAGVIGYSGGVRGPYYTMPFIRGETLRARLMRMGALPPDEVRRILVDVADALVHAHEEGIVHRDIKPDNIFLAGKSALVSDFGVSKALAPSELTGPTTGVGVTLGTPGYMAPEQAAGEPALDHRADIYSVGVLAYELLSGRRPFEGASVHELLVAQAVQTPVPLRELCPTAPPALLSIVMRCLEKRPVDRFQDAATLLAALEALPSVAQTPTAPLPAIAAVPRRKYRIPAAIGAGVIGVAALVALLVFRPWRGSSPGSAEGREASVAVLPPEYFRPDTLVAATLANLVDRISNNLSRVQGLKVVNYMSVGALMRRGSTPTLKDLGAALGVDHFVLFVPRQTGRGAEVAVQLVAAATQAQLWITSYTPDSTNLQDIDNDVVGRVTHALLGAGADLPMTGHSARARREGAHGEYLAGKLALRRRTPEGLAEAIRYFESAIRLDSNHVDALGRLATALALQLSYGYRTTMASYPTAARALVLAQRAVELEPAAGEPIGFRAYIEYLTFAPLDLVKTDFERAISLRTAEADVAGWHALLLLREGKVEESLAESRRALDLDPMSSARHLTYALAALGARRYDLAALEARRARETEPDLRRPGQVEGLALLLLNRAAECAALDLRRYLGVRALCLRGAGRSAEAQAVVDSLVKLVAAPAADPEGRYSDVLPAQEMAIYHAWLGNATETLKYLRLAFERSPVGVDQRIVQSAVFDRVRNSPGFGAELQRMQDSVWPRVLEERQRLDGSGEATPLASLRLDNSWTGGSQ